MFKQIVLFALAIASVSANLAFTNCGSASTIHALRIHGCTAAPCRFVRGEEYYGEVDVTKAVSTPQLPFVVQAVPGFPLPAITVHEGNMCDETPGLCPTTNGQRTTARVYIPIPTTVPAIEIDVRVQVRDGLGLIGGGTSQVCILIRAIIS